MHFAPVATVSQPPESQVVVAGHLPPGGLLAEAEGVKVYVPIELKVQIIRFKAIEANAILPHFKVVKFFIEFFLN
jgi:hypothetical protein